MTGQLALFAPPARPATTRGAPPPDGTPPGVVEILRAALDARAAGTTITRSHWGIHTGVKHRWVLSDGGCCCALSALLVAREATTLEGDRSPRAAAARLLGVTDIEVGEFVCGFDGLEPGGLRPEWHGYGRWVAGELGL